MGPSDLITLYVAVEKYETSRATLKRAIEDGRLQTYRPENAAKNAAHRVSESAVARFWRARPNKK